MAMMMIESTRKKMPSKLTLLVLLSSLLWCSVSQGATSNMYCDIVWREIRSSNFGNL
jgi:hypothetical protein